MATIASGVATLNDVLAEIAPDGSAADTAEVLTQHTEVLEDMCFMEGNLITGHRDSVRTVIPEPSFRAINAGVPNTKGAVTQIEETCALLEDFSQADRELAILSGNVNNFRLRQGRPHQIGFAHKMASTLFYGNAANDPKSYTGLAPRYNTLDENVSLTAENVLDAGGTGTGLRSIWLVGWSEETITGLYPKGTMGGLQHEDVTNASGDTIDGVPPAAVLQDGNGGSYMGYRDHWIWRCGLMVKDWRYAVRIANIDIDSLTNDASSGAKIQELMVEACERIEGKGGVKPAFYMPRTLRTRLRQQILNTKNTFLTLEQIAGKEITMFDGVPVRRTDALNVEETRVTA